MLALEKTSDEHMSNFVHEFLQDVLRMVEVCFVEAEVKRNTKESDTFGKRIYIEKMQ